VLQTSDIDHEEGKLQLWMPEFHRVWLNSKDADPVQSQTLEISFIYQKLFDLFDWVILQLQSLASVVYQCPPWTWPLWATLAVPAILLVIYLGLKTHWNWWQLAAWAFLLSVPWEFMRIYQMEFAKKVALTSQVNCRQHDFGFPKNMALRSCVDFSLQREFQLNACQRR
jgi:hypothetical protein